MASTASQGALRLFASSHFFASHNENFAAAIVVGRVWMVAGVLVHSASLQWVLQNNFIILKWLDEFSGGICVVVLPVQAEAWVSDGSFSPCPVLGRSSFSGKLTMDILLHCLLERTGRCSLRERVGSPSPAKSVTCKWCILGTQKKAAQEALLPPVRPEEGLLKVSVEVC